MLLHLHVQLLALLSELIDDFCESTVVRLLLFLLLALGAVGDGDLPIGCDLLFKVFCLRTHLILLVFHALATVIVVPLRSNLILQLDQSTKVVLEFRQLAFNFDILRA